MKELSSLNSQSFPQIINENLIVDNKWAILMPFYGISLKEAIRKFDFTISL